MIHAFILIVLLDTKVISNDMIFYDVERCNYFASQLVKNFGNYSFSYRVPKEHRRTAYCKPILVDPKKTEIYK